MGKGFPSDSALWEEFQQAARKRRRNPVRLLKDYTRHCIAVWKDQTLDEVIWSDAQRRGHSEKDAVDIVRPHRFGKTYRAAR